MVTSPADPKPPADAARIPTGLWQKMRADPEYAPEHLALEAVGQLGPHAAAWVAGIRRRYPGMDADTVARVAVRRFRTRARMSGAAAGATGLPGAVVDMGVLAWLQAQLVLCVAAAYGRDPTHADRATDLLVLQGVHEVAESARTALAVARGRENVTALLRADARATPSTRGEPTGAATPTRAPDHGAARTAGRGAARLLTTLTWNLARMSGVRAAKRLFAKVIPGAGILLGSLVNSRATTELGRRAVAHYRSPDRPTHPKRRQQ